MVNNMDYRLFISGSLICFFLILSAGCGSGGVQVADTPAQGKEQGKQEKREKLLTEPLDDSTSVRKGEGYTYIPLGRRDPYKSPIIKTAAGEVKVKKSDTIKPLQKIELARLKLIAVTWGDFGYKAMLEGPDGKGYIIKQGAFVGPNSGIVTKINSDEVTVSESFVDLYGETQIKDTVLKLHPYKGEQG